MHHHATCVERGVRLLSLTIKPKVDITVVLDYWDFMPVADFNNLFTAGGRHRCAGRILVLGYGVEELRLLTLCRQIGHQFVQRLGNDSLVVDTTSNDIYSMILKLVMSTAVHVLLCDDRVTRIRQCFNQDEVCLA